MVEIIYTIRKYNARNRITHTSGNVRQILYYDQCSKDNDELCASTGEQKQCRYIRNWKCKYVCIPIFSTPFPSIHHFYFDSNIWKIDEIYQWKLHSPHDGCFSPFERFEFDKNIIVSNFHSNKLLKLILFTYFTHLIAFDSFVCENYQANSHIIWHIVNILWFLLDFEAHILFSHA